ncbi:uncharacterized protein LOC131433075 [Malaya genurostris]|uniref:uncharacterized protein LOC131433075 n=1 Tax=Malaya genurostris TaxID=325434 RepID=UPI0026F3B9AC|nr:uncharacterized protein LOC131433075 [Malaya genurostris]
MSAKRTLTNSESLVPKKFFRYTLKGVNFFGSQTGEGCSLDDLVAYSYLKNQKADRLEVVRMIMEQTTTSLRSHGLLIQSNDGKYQLTHVITNFNEITSGDPSNSPTLSNETSTVPNDPRSDETSSLPRSNETVQPESPSEPNSNAQPETLETPSPSKSVESTEGEQFETSKLLNRMGKEVVLPNHREHSGTERDTTNQPTDWKLMPELMPLSFDDDPPTESTSKRDEKTAAIGNHSKGLPELMPPEWNIAGLKLFNYDDDSD